MGKAVMSDKSPEAGVLTPLENDLACVLAPNPSPMTYWGTNTYLLGHENLAIIDPGPNDPKHLEALVTAIAGRRVSHILVTHSHLDHSPLARPLADVTGAPILAFGDSSTGRSEIMTRLAASGQMGGGEGVDHAFQPDVILASGDKIEGDGWKLSALHTPGHFGNHMCFLWGDAAFCGDHLMGWASSLVSPPDGDLTDFMSSCHALAATGVTRGYSAHGAPINDAQTRLSDLISHRLMRESEIILALEHAPADPLTLTKAIYKDVPEALFPMAQRNVLAHLIDLTARDRARPFGGPNAPLTANSKFTLI